MSHPNSTEKPPTLSAGDWVEVRSKEEILQTLDRQGRLDGMPFMPEMFSSCGRRFRVWKRAHKTCDTIYNSGGRQLADAVHLEDSRCDGAAHGGCQAACLIFWKTVWLKPVAGPSAESTSVRPTAARPHHSTACTEEVVLASTRVPGAAGDPEPTYACQATLLLEATKPLPWWDLRQYIEDYTSGNTGLRQIFAGAMYSTFNSVARRIAGPRLRRLYDRFQQWRGGVPYPLRKGTVPEGQPTPVVTLNLQPGETVQVKSYPEILATLDGKNKNRGLFFDAEEVPFCGKTFQVRHRVKQIINEQTGKMTVFKTDSVILEGVYCQARYSDKRLFCPRAVYPMWREAWLARTTAAPASAAEAQAASNGQSGSTARKTS